MIAVDWGTTNFRAYLLDETGTILARSASPRGILAVTDGNFEQALRVEAAAWLAEGESHVLLCGMIGSRQGWLEAKYLPCPAGLPELAAGVVTIPFAGATVRLVPGVSGRDAAGVPEVMRGEETAAMGIMETVGGEGVVCFPGTHSKWIELQNGRMTGFTTSMTGEIFSAVRKHTILGRMMAPAHTIDAAVFLQGVARSADSGGLLHHLFGVRTLGLTGQLAEPVAASYLSGLLIGHEVRSALAPLNRVHLVGTDELCALYAQAIEACGGAVIVESEDAAALGLAAIARRLEWK